MKAYKRKRSWIENYKVVFFELGIIVALSLALMAFEWRSYEKLEIGVAERTTKWEPIEEVVLDSYVEPEKLPQIPKPNYTLLVEVSNDELLDDPDIDFQIFDDEGTNGVVWEKPVVVDEPEIEEPIDIPDVSPEFPGGENALFRFLYDNLSYPQVCKDAGISGTVYVKFVVEKQGNISGIEIIRSPHDELSDATIRVINKMPRWNPGIQDGNLVRVNFGLPVKFTLK